jgi:hypothetical protein
MAISERKHCRAPLLGACCGRILHESLDSYSLYRARCSSDHDISLGTCEMVAENGRFGGCFRHPFHQSLTRAPGRFNLFFRLLPPSVPRLAHVFDIFSYSPSLTSSEGPILAPRALFPKWAPRALSPKWASLRSTCGSWLAVYMGPSSQPVFALASLVVLPLLSSALSHECTTIANPPCVSSSTLDRPCVP